MQGDEGRIGKKYYEMRKTAIIGASTNKSRYAYLATTMLLGYGHPIVPLGIKGGSIQDVPILDLNGKPEIEALDTVTLYIGPQHQSAWYEYIISLKPKRVIFNPGTENPEFAKMLEKDGIEATEACTLVLLRAGQF